MKVSLRTFTMDALNTLLDTKSTRINPGASPPADWSQEEKDEHLEYMLDTIKSSWEFVDYTFKIEGVTRAFTHQLVRTRTGSYAEQSLRATDVSVNEVLKPESVAGDLFTDLLWRESESSSLKSYKDLVKSGVPLQDARGILPINITTSIYAKFSLRALHEMAKVRLCTRTQGEYQDVFREMRRLVVEVHPWASLFIQVHCVSTGTCAFPRYGKRECPVYLPEMDTAAVRQKAEKIFWSTRYESKPERVA